MRRRRWPTWSSWLVPLALASCAPGDGATSAAALQAPARAGFKVVADALQPSCGTLDCHGQRGRNLRLYGARGLRLSARDTSAEGATTDAEYDATYWAVVGLEPETLSQVVRDQGNDAERLSIFRKARGVETHKGGTLMRPSDPLDDCLLSWIRDQVDGDACTAVAGASRPEAPAP